MFLNSKTIIVPRQRRQKLVKTLFGKCTESQVI